ncbi:MAG: hypothetical protein Q9201_003782 [Fulgogasparrea decipioides]
MPRQVGTPSKFTQETVVDGVFLPDWMYYYPEYIHERPLQIEVEKELRQIESEKGLKGLKTAVDKWKTSKAFSETQYGNSPFVSHVADAGTKKGSNEDTSVPRAMYIDLYWSSSEFYNRLIAPRTFNLAKKRLIELPSHDQEKVLICWLTTPQQEKPLFLDFLRRHGSSESFFGERVDWKGNIWETEFHLGFYQLISEEDNKRFPPHLDYQSQLHRIKKMPSHLDPPDRRQITLVAVSLRFVGDLRDRSWTCYYFSSVARDDGFTSLTDEFTDFWGEENDFYAETMGQRKLLEMTYIERMLREMEESSEGILAAIQSVLNVPETRDPQNEGYEFNHKYSRLHSKVGEILHDCLQQLNLANRAILEWERREDTKSVRSRWSQKDVKRYGQKLIHLARKCKQNIQHLHMQKNRLEEQKSLAKQRHDDFINYMQLQEARTSSRSAEDVRLFTYVTIIFLPLTFSSSLFSMQGTPAGGTITVMVPTTVVALAVTVVALSSMKVLARNWNFWVYKLTASARKKMKAKKHWWGVSWNKISQELEESAQLRLAKPENEKHLPAESKWWYFLFCLSYIISLPRLCVIEGVRAWGYPKDQNIKPLDFTVRVSLSVLLLPACIIIFTLQLLALTAVDALGLMWKVTRSLGNKIVHSVSHKEEPIMGILSWLQSPPRPIKQYSRKLDASGGEPRDIEPLPAGSEPDPKDSNSTDGDDMHSDKDEWEIAIEKNVVAHNNVGISDTQPAESRQSGATNDPDIEKPSWWTRWKSSITDRETHGSKV